MRIELEFYSWFMDLVSGNYLVGSVPDNFSIICFLRFPLKCI